MLLSVSLLYSCLVLVAPYLVRILLRVSSSSALGQITLVFAVYCALYALLRCGRGASVACVAVVFRRLCVLFMPCVASQWFCRTSSLSVWASCCPFYPASSQPWGRLGPFSLSRGCAAVQLPRLHCAPFARTCPLFLIPFSPFCTPVSLGGERGGGGALICWWLWSRTISRLLALSLRV